MSREKQSFISSLIAHMSNWKMGFAFAVLVLLVGGYAALTRGEHGAPGLALRESASEDTAQKTALGRGESALPMAELDSYMAEEFAEERAIADESDEDMALVTSDSAEMNDYKNTYDETQI